MSHRPVVAIFNSNDDVVELLRSALEGAGMVVVSGHIDAFRRGQQRLSELVQEHDPSVILYDLAPPYDRSWRFLEHLRDVPGLNGRRFLMTSTNPLRAAEIAGSVEQVLEIVGKPYDIDAIIKAVLAAVHGRDDQWAPGAMKV
jgi:CheY-like chemotaxis protein